MQPLASYAWHGPLLGVLVLLYFALLYFLANRASKQGQGNANERFFAAGKQAPWYLVAFGMIGASLSGVTFVSIPGQVGAGGLNQQFSYFQVALGYVLGYAVIATVLLPLYYRLQLTSIYEYLGQRFGPMAQKTGTVFFIASRSIGATFRLYLSTAVLHAYIFESIGLPFALTAFLSLVLIWLYTRREGLQAIVWTDTLQTFFMLVVLIISVIYIANDLNLSSPSAVWQRIENQNLGKIFFFEQGWSNPNHFVKQFLSGAFICLAMTGLDQDMMQKNLSCRNLKEAQKNMYTFSGVLLFVNFCFLILGALLWLYAQDKLQMPLGAEGLNALNGKSDALFPMLAFEHFPAYLGLLFVLGLIAATYSSADSSMTALTTSVCVDLLAMKSMENQTQAETLRSRIHKLFVGVFFAFLIFFHYFSGESVLNALFKAAGYTYGPLLALFAYGLMLPKQLNPHPSALPWVCLTAMLLSFFIQQQSPKWGYVFGFELLLLNALLCFLGLLLTSKLTHPSIIEN